jgi:hypothetical protein
VLLMIILCKSGMHFIATDEYCKTSKSTAMESLKRFCVAIRAKFGAYPGQTLRSNWLLTGLSCGR